MDEECVVVIPAKFADGRRVVVQKCTKTEREHLPFFWGVFCGQRVSSRKDAI